MDKTLFSYKGIKPVLAGLAILTVIQGAIVIIQAYFLADAISSLFGGDLFANVFKKLIIFFLALVVRQLLTVWKRNIVYHFAARTSKELRESLLQKLFQLGPRFVKEEGSGQTVTLVMEGMMKFRRYLELILPKLMNSAIIPVMICIFIFFVNIRSAVILGLAVPILIAFMILLGLAAKIKADRQYESYQMLSNHFVDSLRGLETLKYLGLSRQHINKIILVSERYRRATMETLRIAFLSSFALDFFTMLSIATVAVFLGMDLINGKMELRPALTILILAPEYFLPIREVGADYHATLDGKEAGKKIQEILDKESLQQKQDPIPLWKSTSTFSVKGVSVHFADSDRPALQDIQFSVSGSKKIGIIGASGAGKSTLIDTLSGFLTPSSGEFQVNGKKLTTLSQLNWQNQITYIPQHPYIFHDTVLNNIRFYDPEATVKEVEEAAERAGLTEVIQSLPQGFETIIGEGGRSLSGGQEQRIALARAFLSNRPIIILDEPTAHLDIETEYELKETMLQLFNGKLVFFATHRLHWMLDMDQIIVLDQGKIVEIGTHEQLIGQNSTYYQLVKTQMEGI
ncbi:thiol reductant ABC exporter subunit CydD [Anoxybacteroides amylolyticum]|uniref:Thiol reductant ABC exporter, CydD subunit n=1 Tax=Anoxybacteroides amylolyticum TaxID=294699 RepID=A0A167T3S4_9BACL|nr:thiol reductant ABC exporter subunit CydD [Anoxybacillus amylolyticus]ANB59406.1 thiol reductant ABC exporter, CydD subunit [Anoxybacillus amylolyticus]